MAKRKGPKVVLRLLCHDCQWETGERYAVQGDSGYRVSCTHPDAPAPAHIGDTTWTTPDWCPVRKANLAKFFREHVK